MTGPDTAPTSRRDARRAARGSGARGKGNGNDQPQLRLRAVRRAEPDMRKLVEWVLNITQARHDAHRDGRPDPYGLPAPENLSRMSDMRGRVEEEPAHQRRSTA